MTPDEALQERQADALEHIGAGLERIAVAGERLAAVLERMDRRLAGEEPIDGEAAAPACDHPPAVRTDLGGTMGHPHWRCEACGYVHRG